MEVENQVAFEEQRVKDEVGQVEPVVEQLEQAASAMAETPIVVAEEPAPLPPPDRKTAAGHVERFLGQQGSLRDATVAELNDDEVRQLLEAGNDRHTARQVIKDVISRAYDRRRDAAATEARDRESALRRSSSALAVLQGPLGMTADDSAKVLAKLTSDEQKALAELVDDADAASKASTVLNAAEERARRAAAGDSQSGP